MIYIFASNLYEAKPFLKRFQLQRDFSQDKLEVYYNPQMFLVVTRPGSIAASVSVSSFMSQRRPSATDIILSVSLCDSTKPEFKQGSLYLVYKIIEYETNKRYFPDLLFRHPFSEAAISSASLPFYMLKKQNCKLQVQTELVDMEAASIVQTLMAVSITHHVYFFRIVAGYGECEKRTPVLTEQLVSQNQEAIMEYIIDLQSELRKEYELEYDEIRIIKNFCKFFCLSPGKEQELMELMYFYKTENENMTEVLAHYQEERKETDVFTRIQGFVYYQEVCKKMSDLFNKNHKKVEEL